MTFRAKTSVHLQAVSSSDNKYNDTLDEIRVIAC